MNKVMLIGNVGAEPDVRYYDRDQAVAQVSLATTERGYTLQNGTQVPDHTDWHHLLFYRGLAKVVEKYVHKGDRLYVEGRIRYRSYNDKEGRRHYVTEILVENMEMLSSKDSSAASQAGAAMPPKDQAPDSPQSSSPAQGEGDKNALPF
nr:single-stranded DNA-binding protein [uncultured Prevotella sp.]